VYSFKVRSKTGCLLPQSSYLLFDIIPKILAHEIKQDINKLNKYFESILIEKEEIKFSLFAGDMTIYTENPKGKRKQLFWWY
jgi:hypothetical protein